MESKQGRLVCCCCRYNEATKKAVQQQQQIRTPKWQGLSSSLHEARAAVDFDEVIFSVSKVCHLQALKPVTLSFLLFDFSSMSLLFICFEASGAERLVTILIEVKVPFEELNRHKRN